MLSAILRLNYAIVLGN